MNAETRKALEASIKKWERIVAGTGVDEGADNCALCELFYNARVACVGCPVRNVTGLPGCLGSPYRAWGRAVVDNGQGFNGSYRASTPALKKLARAELKFLKGLLPEKRIRPRSGEDETPGRRRGRRTTTSRSLATL